MWTFVFVLEAYLDDEVLHFYLFALCLYSNKLCGSLLIESFLDSENVAKCKHLNFYILLLIAYTHKHTNSGPIKHTKK